MNIGNCKNSFNTCLKIDWKVVIDRNDFATAFFWKMERGNCFIHRPLVLGQGRHACEAICLLLLPSSSSSKLSNLCSSTVLAHLHRRTSPLLFQALEKRAVSSACAKENDQRFAVELELGSGPETKLEPKGRLDTTCDRPGSILETFFISF